jgi:hypothetical protein
VESCVIHELCRNCGFAKEGEKSGTPHTIPSRVRNMVHELISRWNGTGLGIELLDPQVRNYELQRRKLVQEDFTHRSYNILFDRMQFEGLIEYASQEELDAFLQEVRMNLETNLRERFHVVENSGRYIIRDGDIYSELFPKEPMGRVFLRGASVREMKGSKEWQREGIHGELGGWIIIHNTFVELDPPIGTQIVSFSPPGELPETAYRGRFIDLFTLKQDKQGKYIERKRLAVNYTKEEYKKKALELQPDFFDDYAQSGLPLDAWFLSHPITTEKDISNLLKLGQGMSNEQFKRLFSDQILQQFVNNYITVLCKESMDWKDAEVAFNAILTRADEIQGVVKTQIRFSSSDKEVIYQYGILPVREVTGGGCPTNKGYSIFEDPFKTSYSNSVLKFGMETSSVTWDYHRGDCVVCKKEGIDVGPCSICKECEKKF